MLGTPQCSAVGRWLVAEPSWPATSCCTKHAYAARLVSKDVSGLASTQMRKAYDDTEWLLDHAVVRRKRTTSRVLRRAKVHERFTVLNANVWSRQMFEVQPWTKLVSGVFVTCWWCFLRVLGMANERSD